MRKSKFSEHQIIAILKAVEAGRTVRDVCREHEVSEATYYQWKSKYGGMEAADIRRLRELGVLCLKRVLWRWFGAAFLGFKGGAL